MNSRAVAADESPNGRSAAVAGHVIGLTESGLPLSPGLRALSEEIGDRKLRRSLRAVADRIDAGDPVAAALAAPGAGLPEPIRELLRAGHASGHLVGIVAELNSGRNFDLELRRKLLSSLIYPLSLLVTLGALFTYGATGIAAQYDKVFADFGTAMPGLTAGLIWLTSALSHSAARLVLGTLALALLGFAWWRFMLTPAGRSRWLQRIPIIGRLSRWTGEARFARGLALMIDAGLPAPAAIRLAADLTDDADLRQDFEQVARDVEEGNSLANSVARCPRIDPILVQVMAWSEGKQSLTGGLRLAAEALEVLAREQAQITITTSNILIFIFVMLGLGIFVAGLLWPVLSLISAMSGMIILPIVGPAILGATG